MHPHIKQMALLIVVLGIIISIIPFVLPERTVEYVETQAESFIVSGTQSNNTERIGTYQSLTRDAQEENGGAEEIETNPQNLQAFLKQYADIYDIRPPTNTGEEIEVLDGEFAYLKEYGNDMGRIITTHLVTDGEVGVRAINTLIENPENIEALETLRVIAREYRAAGEALTALVPPTEFDTQHKAFTEMYTQIAEATDQLLESGINGESSSVYNERVIPFIDVYVEIARLFRIYGVVFDASEPGSIFTLPF